MYTFTFIAAMLLMLSQTATQVSTDAGAQPQPLAAQLLHIRKGTKFIVRQSNDAELNGTRSHLVMTAEHTITNISKDTITLDTHNRLDSSTGDYFHVDGDAPGQEFLRPDDHLTGETGEPAEIYVETPVFSGSVRVLYEHMRAVGEIRRWVSTDPVEIEITLQDGNNLRVRAIYVKELTLLDGINWLDEGLYCEEFDYIPIWAHYTRQRPDERSETFEMLTRVEQTRH